MHGRPAQVYLLGKLYDRVLAENSSGGNRDVLPLAGSNILKARRAFGFSGSAKSSGGPIPDMLLQKLQLALNLFEDYDIRCVVRGTVLHLKTGRPIADSQTSCRGCCRLWSTAVGVFRTITPLNKKQQ
jgi:hypothetical protein